MKIIKKTHFWKDSRTFMEIEYEEPKTERGYPAEGNFLLKIGEQSSIKSAFKLSPDEARAVRDAFTMALASHDKKMAELMSIDSKEQYSPYSSQPSNDYPSQSSYSSQNDYSSGNYSSSQRDEDDYSSGNYAPKKEEYSYKPEYTKMPTEPKKPESNFFIFGDDKEPKKEEKKPNVEFYF